MPRSPAAFASIGAEYASDKTHYASPSLSQRVQVPIKGVLTQDHNSSSKPVASFVLVLGPLEYSGLPTALAEKASGAQFHGT